jgi:hypothetical protein
MDYDGVSLRHEITGLDIGLLYKFAVIAVNSEGNSEMSSYVTIATSSLPDQPQTIFKSAAISNQTSLYLHWDKVADKEIPTSGYLLEMAQAFSQDFTIVYNGANLPQETNYLVQNLETGSSM